MHNPAIDPAYAEELLCNFPPIEGLAESCEIEEASEERCQFTVCVPETLRNYRGTIHGGGVYLLSEVGCGVQTYALGQSNVCMQANINFIKAIPCGKRVRVVSETHHRGRTSALIRVTIFDVETGKKVSESSHTMFLFGPLEK